MGRVEIEIDIYMNFGVERDLQGQGWSVVQIKGEGGREVGGEREDLATEANLSHVPADKAAVAKLPNTRVLPDRFSWSSMKVSTANMRCVVRTTNSVWHTIQSESALKLTRTGGEEKEMGGLVTMKIKIKKV